MAASAARERSGGHTATLTSSPTTMPIPVSSKRENSIASSVNPVVSTTSPVVATVVASSPNHRRLPSSRQMTSTAATAAVVGPIAWPTADATNTATTAADTCWSPRENVR